MQLFPLQPYADFAVADCDCGGGGACAAHFLFGQARDLKVLGPGEAVADDRAFQRNDRAAFGPGQRDFFRESKWECHDCLSRWVAAPAMAAARAAFGGASAASAISAAAVKASPAPVTEADGAGGGVWVKVWPP